MDESGEPDLPWQIVIRDPEPRDDEASAAPGPAPSAIGDSFRFLPIVGVATVGFVLFILAAVILTRDTGDPAPEVAGVQVERVPTAGADDEPGDDPPPSTTEATTPTTATTQPTTTGPVTAPAPPPADTTAPRSTAPPPGVPVRSPSDWTGGWVSQLSSVPMRAGSRALQTSYDTVVESVPEAIVVVGDEWPALRDGYWVIVAPDLASGEEAIEVCDRSGRTSNDDCYGRYLSQDPADSDRVCLRGDDGLRGDC